MTHIMDKVRELHEKGRIAQAVLIDAEGMLISSVGSVFDAETLGGAFSSLRPVMKTIQETLDFGGSRSLTLIIKDTRFWIHWRAFAEEGQDYVLITIYPPPEAGAAAARPASSRPAAAAPPAVEAPAAASPPETGAGDTISLTPGVPATRDLVRPLLDQVMAKLTPDLLRDALQPMLVKLVDETLGR